MFSPQLPLSGPTSGGAAYTVFLPGDIRYRMLLLAWWGYLATPQGWANPQEVPGLLSVDDMAFLYTDSLLTLTAL